MRLFDQLELEFADLVAAVTRRGRPAPEKQRAVAGDRDYSEKSARDEPLEILGRDLLRTSGARKTALALRVEWNSRLRSAAGRADYRRALVCLNPRLREHGAAEINRTFRHELAHLLAQARAGRRRIAPHGSEWRRACAELGIADEPRCHDLPLPVTRLLRRFVYECPGCRKTYPRARRLRKTLACLACCRAHNRGRFDPRFRLRIAKTS